MDQPPSPFRVIASGDRTVTVTRGFASPGQRILRAHIDPDIAPLWLGTPQAPLRDCQIDPRPGGRFRYVWKQPDGGKMVASGQFIDLTATRIRHEETYDPDWTDGPVQVTTEIGAQGHGTLLTLSMRYRDRTTRDRVLASAMPETLRQSYDRLEALLDD
mgnify:CR=1 FL=1